MPIPKNKAIKTYCKNCSWHQVIWQNSDVLTTPTRCKQCGNEKLEYSEAGKIESLWARARFIQGQQ